MNYTQITQVLTISTIDTQCFWYACEPWPTNKKWTKTLLWLEREERTSSMGRSCYIDWL